MYVPDITWACDVCHRRVLWSAFNLFRLWQWVPPRLAPICFDPHGGAIHSLAYAHGDYVHTHPHAHDPEMHPRDLARTTFGICRNC
jgi:hypothetical protein